MKPSLPVAGILLACGIAFLVAGCASAPSRGAQLEIIHTYGIVAADDRGVLSPPEFDKIQIGLVQILVSQGYVNSSQRFTPDIRQADVVFRVTIAWHGTGNSFAVVDVMPTYDGVTAIAEAPAAPLAGPPPAYAGAPYPYDPWIDDYYDYPDFGYAYEPYLPIFGLTAFFPIFDYPFHRRSYHSDNRSRHHGVPWRDNDRRTAWSSRDRDHRRSPDLVPLRPHRSDSGDRRLGWGAWRPRASGPDHRPSSAKSPAQHPDRSAAGVRPLPPPRGPARDAIQAPIGRRPPPATARTHPTRPDHRPPSGAITPRPPLPDRRAPTAAVAPRPAPANRRLPAATAAPRPPAPDRRSPAVAAASRPPPRREPADRRPAYRDRDSRPAPPSPPAARAPARVASERAAPTPPRAESTRTSHRSDSGGRSSPSQVSAHPARTSSPPPDRSDSVRSRSVAESDRRSKDR